MINNPNTLPPGVQAYMDRVLLSVQTPRLIHSLGAIRRELPAKNGNTLRQSRYSRLPTAPNPLGPSGAPIPGTPLARTDIDAKIEYYGLFVPINQQVVLNNQDPVLNEVGELLGLSMRMTEDLLMRDMLLASASAYNAQGGLNGDQPTNISVPDIDQVTTRLSTNDAWMMLDRIGGEDKFGTAPIRDSYLGMCHTNLQIDLNNLSQFTPKWNYPNQNRTIGAEWGAIRNLRVMTSSVGSISPNASALGADVYNFYIQGLEAIGCVYQTNATSRFLYRPPVFSDALFQNITLGYVFAEAPVLLNDLWVQNLRVTLNT